ncbi:unnamed protein product [Coregonus sp. 'balchen']|nr:unnamed protein product [Coregonus sp. 'balchen']
MMTLPSVLPPTRRVVELYALLSWGTESLSTSLSFTESQFLTSKFRTRGPTSMSLWEGSGVSQTTRNLSLNSCICWRKQRGSVTFLKDSAMLSARLCSSNAALSLLISGSIPSKHFLQKLCEHGRTRGSSKRQQQIGQEPLRIFASNVIGRISEERMYGSCTDVVIVKSGRRICGTGCCLANAPLHQNKSIWGIGVATQKVNLNQVPLGRDINSLVLRHDGSVYHNNEEKNRLPANSLPQEGDIVGITYDHVEMNLYLNGKNMHCPASGIRGTVFPVVYVDDSAILDCQFSDFCHTAPQGFEKILFEQQIF